MMMKGLGLNETNNLNSTLSGETSLSSTTTNTTTMLCPQQASSSSFISSPPNQPPTKKKRGLPGNPDPDAEVIALSPKSLLATNRFICEICNKGFQRDQNLQLHRRGHNLPWKLKQRDKDQVIRKKVYVCPVNTCVHHDPARALGDLTGIKKHYCRKHGEKKWKCNKCSKKYAVQSDWKAHSKICGTREYRCDCGTLFSRRDSFITHRAFCDALTEAGRVGGSSTILPNLIPQSSTNLHNPLHAFPLKREFDDQHFNFNTRPDNIPSWLTCPPPPSMQPQQQLGLESGHSSMPCSQMEDQLLLFQQYNSQFQQSLHDPDPSQMNGFDHAGPALSSFQTSPSPYISATSLLQRAAEVGMTINNNSQQQQQQHYQYQQHQVQNLNQNQSYIHNQNQNHNQTQTQTHTHTRQVSSHGVMFPTSNDNSNKIQPHTHVPMGISSSRDQLDHYANTNFIQGQVVTSQGQGGAGEEPQSSMLHDMMIMSSFQSSSTLTKPSNDLHAPPAFGEFHEHRRQKVAEPKPPPPTDGGAKRGGGEGLTRDFLGLRPTAYFHKDFLNMAGLSHINSPSSSSAPFDHQQLNHHNHKPW